MIMSFLIFLLFLIVSLSICLMIPHYSFLKFSKRTKHISKWKVLSLIISTEFEALACIAQEY